MGDPTQPTNPADALPSAPAALRDFLSCTSDAVTIKDGPLTWLNPNVSLTIVPDDDNPNAANLRIGFKGFGPALPAQITDGQLSIDTSGLAGMADLLSSVAQGADKLPGQIDDLVRNINGWFKAHGKQLGAPIVASGAIRLVKVPVPVVGSTPQPVAPTTPVPGTGRQVPGGSPGSPDPGPADVPGPAVVHLGDHDITLDPPPLPWVSGRPPAGAVDPTPAVAPGPTSDPNPNPIPKADVKPLGDEVSGTGATGPTFAPTPPAVTSSSVDEFAIPPDQVQQAVDVIRKARESDQILVRPPDPGIMDRPGTIGLRPSGRQRVDRSRLAIIAGAAIGGVAVVTLLLLGRSPSTTPAAAASSASAPATVAQVSGSPSAAPVGASQALPSGPAWTPWPMFDLVGAQDAVNAVGTYKVAVSITRGTFGSSQTQTSAWTIDAVPPMRTIVDGGTTYVDDGTTMTKNGQPITDTSAIAKLRSMYDPFPFLQDIDANWTSLAYAARQPATSQAGGHTVYVYRTTQGAFSLQILVDRDTGFPYLFAGSGFQRGSKTIPNFRIEFTPEAPPPPA